MLLYILVLIATLMLLALCYVWLLYLGTSRQVTGATVSTTVAIPVGAPKAEEPVFNPPPEPTPDFMSGEDGCLDNIILRGSAGDLLRTARLVQMFHESHLMYLFRSGLIGEAEIRLLKVSQRQLLCVLESYDREIDVCIRDTVRLVHDMILSTMVLNLWMRNGKHDVLAKQCIRELRRRANFPWSMFQVKPRCMQILADSLSSACESLSAVQQWVGNASLANSEQSFVQLARSRKLFSDVELYLGICVD